MYAWSVQTMDGASHDASMTHSVDCHITASGASSLLASAARPFPRHLIIVGFLVLGLFVASLGVWSSLAPIEGAVVAPGILSVASHRKQIQHLEGGIVKSILVDDDERVVKGQLLVQLRDVKPATELRKLNGRLIEAQAEIARLNAELDGNADIRFPPNMLTRKDDPAVRSAMSGQQSLLHSLNSITREKLAIMAKKIAQTEEQIHGLNARIKAKSKQRRLMLEELKTVRKALKHQLIPKSEELKLRQRLAQTEGDLAGYQAEISELDQNILQMKLQKNEEKARRISRIMEQLRTQRALEFDLSQKIIAASDVLRRTKIRSPIDGVVVNLQIHSPGGVIEPGQPLMEIVPSSDELIVDTFIDPDDIEELRVGMAADVRLTSVSRRQRIPIQGVLAELSADRLSDPITGQDYYRARIELSPESASSINVNLVAGMGANVFLKTSTRTPLEYLLSPITRSLQQGLREN